jgi:hypothetical protein
LAITGQPSPPTFGIGNLAYLAAIGIAFFSPTASLAVSGLVAIYYVFEQTPASGTVNLADENSPGSGSTGS